MRWIVWVASMGVVGCGDTQPDKHHGPGKGHDDPPDTDEDEGEDEDEDGDGSPASADCDDDDPDVYPGAPERCRDGRITDCDRSSEEGTISIRNTQEAFTDLQQALDAAVADDIIDLCAGTYSGRFVAPVPVHIEGDGADQTTLTADGLGTVLSLPGDSILGAVTVRDGASGLGGGVRMTSAGTLGVGDCIITSNQAESGGGIAVAQDSSVALTDTLIQNNSAAEGGGGLWVGANSIVFVYGSTEIVSNQADRYGAGVWLTDNGTLVGGVIRNNIVWAGEDAPSLDAPFTEQGGGGGIAITGDGSVQFAEIYDNQGPGGGVAVLSGSAFLLQSSVHDNVGLPYGGGVLVVNGSFDATDSTITANTASEGAGVTLVGSWLVRGEVSDNDAYDAGGGVYGCWDSAVTETMITGNTASQYGGGVYGAGELRIDGALVEDNEAQFGGGVALSVSGGDINDSLLVGNRASRGGGLWTDSPSIWVLDTHISDNDASLSGGGITARGTISMDGGSVVRNVAALGGGGETDSGGSLLVNDVDFGEGANDNTPSDLYAGSEYTGYGIASTFACGVTSCTPAP